MPVPALDRAPHCPFGRSPNARARSLSRRLGQPWRRASLTANEPTPPPPRLALRNGFPRRRDKDRFARVQVPAEWPVRLADRHGEGHWKANSPLTAASLGDRTGDASRRNADQHNLIRPAVERSMWQDRLALDWNVLRMRPLLTEAAEFKTILTASRPVSPMPKPSPKPPPPLPPPPPPPLPTKIARRARSLARCRCSRALAAEGDRRAAEARAEDERARADVLDQAIAGARARADALTDQVEAAEAAFAAERGRADAPRSRVDELKRLLASILRSQG